MRVLTWRLPRVADTARCAALRSFSAAQLAAAAHQHELVPEPWLHVHCDGAHMGLGGDDSWTRSCHAEHLVLPGGPPRVFALALRALAEGDDADAVYREAIVLPALRQRAAAGATDEVTAAVSE